VRVKLIALVCVALAQAGCAGGFRVGGNNFGAGFGGYIGPVPDAIRPEHSSYVPCIPAPVVVPERAQ
jgi:hypothetical protein